MGAQAGSSATVLACHDHRLNLRELQAGALESLYIATALTGLALVAAAAEFEVLPALLVALPLFLLPFPAYTLLAGCYLARAWLLVVFWLGGALVCVLLMPTSPAPCLLALPVGLAALLIDGQAGLLASLGASLALLAVTRATPQIRPLAWGMGLALVWGMFGLIWLSLRPLHEALVWSWERYELARRQADQARDAQADLKQAVKDLAEAGVQTARLNQLLGAARRAAEEAERAKTQFVANVSHELRTPLNMIIGFAEMMMQSPRAYGRIPPALQADLAVILRNSQHLSDLIDDVLDLSQIESGQMALLRERVPLSEIVAAAVEAIRPLFDSKGLSLSTEVAGDIVLFCDRTRLREVLLNLLSNAGRFTERGGVQVRARIEGQEAIVSVADTGPGIAAEDQGQLFQPFHQVDGSLRRRHGGSGLGLSISKRFVELHGGSIWLESEVGRGTTISFRLPIEPPPADDHAFRRWLNPEWEYHESRRKALVSAPTVPPRLLVLERGEVLARLLRRHMADKEIVSVGSLEEAIEEMNHVPAQALVINNPSVGSTLDSLRESAPLPRETPIIICTVPGMREAAEALGAADYLLKPISQDKLLAALDRLKLKGNSLLVVDDEPEVARLFLRMFAAAGRHYQVLRATDAEQALAILREQRPDAVLLDLVMPNMGGFHVLEAKKQDPCLQDVPFIVISARDPVGYPMTSDSLAVTRAGGISAPQLLTYIEELSQTAPTGGTGYHGTGAT